MNATKLSAPWLVTLRIATLTYQENVFAHLNNKNFSVVIVNSLKQLEATRLLPLQVVPLYKTTYLGGNWNSEASGTLRCKRKESGS